MFQIIAALFLASNAAAAVAIPTESRNYVQSVRIVAVTTTPAPGGTVAENKSYVMDVNAFGLSLSTSIPYLDTVNTFTVPQIFRSSVTGAFFGDGSNLTGVSGNGETAYFANAKTFASSVTVQGAVSISSNVNMANGSGISYGVGTTTVQPNGTAFFISSTTVFAQNGSTSTYGTALTYFSTYTVAANTLINPGDEIYFECATKNGTAVGTPVQGLDLNSGTVLNTGAVTTANQINIMVMAMMLYDTKAVMIRSSQIIQIVNNSNATSLGNTAGNGNTFAEVGFDNTINNTIHCYGSRAGGGGINFLWMKVWKR